VQYQNKLLHENISCLRKHSSISQLCEIIISAQLCTSNIHQSRVNAEATESVGRLCWNSGELKCSGSRWRFVHNPNLLRKHTRRSIGCGRRAGFTTDPCLRYTETTPAADERAARWRCQVIHLKKWHVLLLKSSGLMLNAGQRVSFEVRRSLKEVFISSFLSAHSSVLSRCAQFKLTELLEWTQKHDSDRSNKDERL